MIRSLLLASAAITLSAAPGFAAPASKSTSSAALPASSPFAKPSTLPFQAPDFSKIKDSDYEPAFLAGMAQQKREIEAIANQKAAPTFDNTIVALDNSGQLLERAQLPFFAVSSANTNDAIQAIETRM
jgi:peptidyl-dipeptidase Dcp